MKINKKIRLIIREEINTRFEEERIPNPEADDFVNKKINFLGSHTYGENLGDLNKMYVAYSYGEQHPLFVWVSKEEFKKLRPYEAENLTEIEDDGKKHIHFYSEEIEHEEIENKNVDLSSKKGPWFYNEKPYYVKDKKGRLKPNKWTKKHLEDLRPNEKVQARETGYLQKLIADFKNKYHIGDNSHTDLEPGEK
jgi:hypothetical protein